MLHNIFFQIILLLYLNLNILSKSEDNLTTESLLNWCKKNDIIISPKIKISLENGVEITALEEISEKEELITIPDKMLLTVDKILDYLNSPELKTQYENFKKLKIESYKKEVNDEEHKEEIFLSYLLYLMKHEEEKYKNTEFFQTFKELFLTVEKYVPNSPLLYTNEQKEYISGTYFGSLAKNIKKIIDKEIEIFKKEPFYNKSIDINDYTQKRLFVINRAYDSSIRNNKGKIVIIPIYSLFPFDSLIYNARLVLNFKNGAKIEAGSSIEEGSQITTYIHGRTNAEKMVLEGKINNRRMNYKEIHLIPAYSPYLFYKYDIDDINLIETDQFNLFDPNFIKNSMLFYKLNSDVFGINQDTDLWACLTLKENVGYYKEYIENLMLKIDELFKEEDKTKIDDIKKALEGELMNLNKQYEKIVEKCEMEKKLITDEGMTEDL